MLTIFIWLAATIAQAAPYIELPISSLQPQQLAVVYLEGNELSERIARYYVRARNIPAENLVGIELRADKHIVDPGYFAVARRVIDAKLPATVQAYALAWASPYRVGCMGMTAAFALGYNTQYCASACQLSRPVPYFHSTSITPYDDFSIRPAMMLAAENFADAKALIDRGVQSDNTRPAGKALLLSTSDKNRTVRDVGYNDIFKAFGAILDVEQLQADSARDKQDVLFYFTGIKSVDHLETLSFLPGALADHLTSAGGQLVDSGQMSAMRWLQAGATASYGTAIEPCNFLQKFPNPHLAMWHYLRGATAIEAYWRSVQMPGQGNFIGEPLARPFGGYSLQRSGSDFRLYAPSLAFGRYRLYASAFGIEHDLGEQRVSVAKPFIELEAPIATSYRLQRQ